MNNDYYVRNNLEHSHSPITREEHLCKCSLNTMKERVINEPKIYPSLIYNIEIDKIN
jgi:hypothetical protein